jgi:hypothetical protein
MSFVVKEMGLKRQVLVVSPLDPVYEHRVFEKDPLRR